MDLQIFKDMKREDLETYIEFLLFNYRVMDAFWFIKVSEKFDLPTAEHLNELVWDKVAAMAAKDLKQKFRFHQKGLTGFISALRLFPWCILVGYEIDEKPDEIIISVPNCPAQEARLKRGLGEYVCKDMHMAEFKGFAKIFDEKINVECIFAPPDPHPEDMYCKWRFTMME